MNHSFPSSGNRAVNRFFAEHPVYSTENDNLLNHKNAARWFTLLQDAINKDVYTFENVLQSKSGPCVQVNGGAFTMMSSYDYLGLIGHPTLEDAAVYAIRKFGTGTGGVRLLTGTNQLHEMLEHKISSFIGTEAAIVYNSGYMANIAAITALFKKTDRIIVDEFVHHSIWDGLRILGVVPQIFRHNDVLSLETALATVHLADRTVIITEGIFSMDGDICPLASIVDVKKKYKAVLMVDEAHSMGVLGQGGRGAHEHYGIAAGEVDVYTGSLSKAIPSNGGFIATRSDVALYLKHGSGPYIFSSALTPANTACALKAFSLIETSPERLEKLWQNTSLLADLLKDIGVNTGQSASPVIPIITGDSNKALQLSKLLFNQGYIANAVVYPAVPPNRARLRICCTASQSAEQIKGFSKALKKSFLKIAGTTSCTSTQKSFV
jgi:8-amino-7-oxononanoate synthase